ncbi:nucleolar transcription factor 1-B-like [Bufo bufo]|uniref:nucleolar transcription factor 1-B-like n=1 Tax=Bufo bufo TaxID=8384 RepID=UPI001ABEA92A|nr:nucleolar transcription factor 1-B-like [Bufo bufo]
MAAPSDQAQWSKEDVLTLMETMKSILPSQDNLKFKTTASYLDWNKMAFKNYTGPVCRQKWIEIALRQFRTLSELIHDAEEHVKNQYKEEKLKKRPKKPLAPHFHFFVENRAKYAKLYPEMSNVDLTKILYKKYKELPEKKKMKYIQDYQRQKQEFKRNMAKFREERPDLLQATKKSDVSVVLPPFGKHIDRPRQAWTLFYETNRLRKTSTARTISSITCV